MDVKELITRINLIRERADAFCTFPFSYEDGYLVLDGELKKWVQELEQQMLEVEEWKKNTEWFQNLKSFVEQ